MYPNSARDDPAEGRSDAGDYPAERHPSNANFAGNGQAYAAQLTGFEEVPPISSEARAQAVFQLSADGTALNYKLVAANVNNIMQSHIHLAVKGQNGPVVAWLYPPAAPAIKIPGRFDGVLGEGTIQAANLAGLLAGQTLNALIASINSGEAYVNIHTEQSPGGEIRGQIYLQDANVPLAPLTSDIVGTVTAIAGNNVSVQTDSREIAVTRDNNTVIDTADVGPSGQLAIGVPVQVFFDPATFITSMIELEKPEDIITQVATTRVAGTIISISGMYIMVKTANGEQALVEALTGTALQYEDGTTAGRTALQPGVMIEATVRIGARWATRIEIKR